MKARGVLRGDHAEEIVPVENQRPRIGFLNAEEVLAVERVVRNADQRTPRVLRPLLRAKGPEEVVNVEDHFPIQGHRYTRLAGHRRRGGRAGSRFRRGLCTRFRNEQDRKTQSDNAQGCRPPLRLGMMRPHQDLRWQRCFQNTPAIAAIMACFRAEALFLPPRTAASTLRGGELRRPEPPQKDRPRRGAQQGARARWPGYRNQRDRSSGSLTGGSSSSRASSSAPGSSGTRTRRSSAACLALLG